MSNHANNSDLTGSSGSSGLSLSNTQVLAILLVAGVLLVGVTFVFAKDIGRIPISLWDICTTPAAAPETTLAPPPSPAVSRN